MIVAGPSPPPAPLAAFARLELSSDLVTASGVADRGSRGRPHLRDHQDLNPPMVPTIAAHEAQT